MKQKHSATIHPKVHKPETTRWNALKKESTISLLRRIVENSDMLALHVFHETRTLFYRNGKWVRLAEFVRALKDRSVRGAGEDKSTHTNMSEVSNNAYDLTLAKFRNIPSQHPKPVKADKNASDNNRFTWDVDCRVHFKRLLEKIDAELIRETITSEIDIENKVAKIATGFVMGRFDLSMKECKRRNTTSTRYTWHIRGRSIDLFYPSNITAKQFLKWLEDNITDVNPDAPHEKDRIQAIIDNKHPCGAKNRTDDPEIIKASEREDEPWSYQEYPYGTSVRVDDPEIAGEPEMEAYPPIEYNEGSQFCSRLSAYIAMEKSENLEKLRPAIRNLGREGVHDLVSRIFEDMADGQYNLSEVARDFNLSKATLSRFAGSDWRKEVAKNKDEQEDMKQLSKDDIPDLWINTTHVLSENRTFMETVRNTGLGGVIDEILPIVGPKEGHKNERQ